MTEPICPLCKRAPIIHIYGRTYKCKRKLGGCGKMFPAELLGGEVKVIDAKPKNTKSHTDITCVDCGSKRTVKVQDAFQVKRCTECQKAHRSKSRRRYNELRRSQPATS